jgi:hypothetical protein
MFEYCPEVPAASAVKTPLVVVLIISPAVEPIAPAFGDVAVACEASA